MVCMYFDPDICDRHADFLLIIMGRYERFVKGVQIYLETELQREVSGLRNISKYYRIKSGFGCAAEMAHPSRFFHDFHYF